MHASFVASVSADGCGLVLRPIDLVPLEAGRALELWALPPTGAARSPVWSMRTDRPCCCRLLDDTRAFAISVRPPAARPTGQPTGPVVSGQPDRHLIRVRSGIDRV